MENLENKDRLKKIASFYDQEAVEYDDGYSTAVCKAEDTIVAEILTPYLKGNVLDIGAGSGLLCEMREVDNYYGIELSLDMTKAGKNKFPTKDFTVADMHNIPFEDQSFDSIVSLYGPISYSLTPEDLITEIARTLKPGGSVALMPYTQRVGQALEMGGFSTATNPEIEKNFYTKEMAEQILANFDNVQVIGINYFLNTEVRFAQEMGIENAWDVDQMVDFLKREAIFKDVLKPEMARHMLIIGTKKA